MSEATIKMFKTKRDEKRFAAFLSSLGVKSVFVGFDGYGDDGSIRTVHFDDSKDKSVEGAGDAQYGTYPERKSVMKGGRWECVTVKTPCNLREFIRAIVYDALDKTNIDWINNDGGEGSCVFTVNDNGTLGIELEVGSRYTEIEYKTFNVSRTTEGE
jgi:hypothetical protein